MINAYTSEKKFNKHKISSFTVNCLYAKKKALKLKSANNNLCSSILNVFSKQSR